MTVIVERDRSVILPDKQAAAMLAVQVIAPSVIEVSSSPPMLALIQDRVRMVQVGIQGPQGAAGPAGPTGGFLDYIHTQNSPQLVWTADHNLGRYPSITVVDSADTVVIGDAQYTSINQVILTFSAAFSGRAFFS